MNGLWDELRGGSSPFQTSITKPAGTQVPIIRFSSRHILSCALKAKMVDLQVSVAATLLDLLHL